MKAIDCQGLAGGFTLGVKQAGFDISSKHEQPGGFGFKQVEGNRHLLGDFPLDDAPAANWTVDSAEYLFGCPPCSGFSSMSIRAGGQDMRGVEANINHCMWDLFAYAAKCYPYVITMESVPNAAKQGLPLMYALRDWLVEATGHGWYMTHLFHNSLSVGGPSQRPRYFLVLSRLGPFGIATPRPQAIPTLRDVIGDLEPLPLWFPEQERLAAPSWWAARKTDTATVTGHDLPRRYDGEDQEVTNRKRARLQGVCSIGWPEGANLTETAERYWESTGGKWDRETGQLISEGQFPPGYDEKEVERVLYRPAAKAADIAAIGRGEMTMDEYVAKWNRKIPPTSTPHPFITSMYETIRWTYDKPARVFHGGGMGMCVHPTQPRTFTYREAARIMGFPDSWNLSMYPGGEAAFGKAVTVDVGYWLAYWVRNHIEASGQTPDLWLGDEVDDQYLVRKIDVTHDWQQLEDSKAGEKKRAEVARRPA